jgi:hypothetical protein
VAVIYPFNAAESKLSKHEFKIHFVMMLLLTVPLRAAMHQRLGLATDRPLFRLANALFGSKPSGSGMSV